MKRIISKKAVFVLASAFGAFVLMSATGEKMQQRAPWVAPKSVDTIKNPLKGNTQSIAAGKKIYAMYCVVCHGDKGKGNGIAASGLNPRPADHTSAKFQAQSDGAIYWKLTTGNPPMASYAKTLTTEQRWQVVNYMRTLKAK